jgi:AbrB family looped-hinge helix DNA binding protein
MESALTIKGQITIPKEIREHLRVAPGDRVKFFIHPNGTVVLLPKVPITALRGMLASKTNRRASIEEMEEGIAAGATAKFHRGNRP